MKKLLILWVILLVTPLFAGKIAIALHGGAGTILKENMTEEKEREYRATLQAALDHGYAILAKGGSSLDAVEQAIRILEDSPLFNAGRGAVFTHDGKNELDASMMNGKDLNAGAVAGVRKIRNPISLARKVMERSKHVLLVGNGAEAFAAAQGIPFEKPEWFFTQWRWDKLEEVKRKEESDPDRKHGTVGVVALDRDGNLAAGTSTGGMTNKRWGRVGDSPIIGAGTYADNRTCAVSATGHGEYFIRLAVAMNISSRMAFAGVPLQQAADQVIGGELTGLGGTGGIVALDRHGNLGIAFNTPGMYRAWRTEGKDSVVKIFKDKK